jgi:ATP-dependent Clp protease protease subunit
MAGEQQQLPPEVWATFCSAINQDSVRSLINGAANGTQRGVKHLHLLFQSTGGNVSDGIALYNFLKTSPLEITLYNCGAVQSVAAIAYLAAKHRKTSARATFMYHRVTGTAQSVQAHRLKFLAKTVSIDDQRLESIMREHIDMPEENWASLDLSDLWFTAEEAVKAKIADEIGEFAPPVGSVLSNL